MTGDTEPSCPICRRPGARVVLRLDPVPALCHVPHATPESARATPRGRVDLAGCAGCGHMFNAAPDTEALDYASGYENAQHHSPSFSRFLDEMVDDLFDRYDLGGGLVIEFGAGDGQVLDRLRSRGIGRGLAVDPAPAAETPGIDRVRDLTAVGDRAGLRLVLSRHTLEHLSDPVDGLRSWAAHVGPDIPIVLEVPRTEFLLETGQPFDLIHEHLHHFTRASLAECARSAGLESIQCGPTNQGQFLNLHGRTGSDGAAPARGPGRIEPDPGGARDEEPGGALEFDPCAFEAFARSATATLETWDRTLADWARASRRVALWGAGSKGVMFLNLVPSASGVVGVIDVNPKKRGTCLAGTGHRVRAPDELDALGVTDILVMNELYLEEIRTQVGDLGIEARLHPVVGPRP